MAVAALVPAAALVASSVPARAQAIDDPTLDECPPALDSGQRDASTVTNVLQLDDPVAPISIDRRGAPERRRISFVTRLPEEFVAQRDNANFEVVGSLFSPDEGDIEGAVEVSAAPRDEDTVIVSMCIDPAPDGATALHVGEYRARIDFQDERIPETAVDVRVLVGDPSARTGFWVMVVAVAAALAAGTWWLTAALVPIDDPAVRTEALRQSQRVRLRLAALALVAVLLVGVAFHQSDRFDTWSFSMAGFWAFLLFAYGAVAVAIGAVTSGVFKVRELVHGLVAIPRPAELGSATPHGVPTPPTWAPPATPPGARPDPSSDRSTPRRTQPAARPTLVLASAVVVAIVAVTVASIVRGGGDDQDATAPSTTSASPPTSLPSAGVVFDGLEYGVTEGDRAVSDLRSAGFTVFDYAVCSNSIEEPGLLRQVRLAGGGDEIIGTNGATALAQSVSPDTEIDVLVSSGEPCAE
jgi:hypothetical protein